MVTALVWSGPPYRTSNFEKRSLGRMQVVAWPIISDDPGSSHRFDNQERGRIISAGRTFVGDSLRSL